MEQHPWRPRVWAWFGRLLWLAGGAFLVLTGFWVVPPCVTHRMEMVNLESVPADVELSLVTGWGETSLWRGRLDHHNVRDLAFDLGRSEGHYRLQGRYANNDEPWDREFVYVSTNYDMRTDVVLVGSKTIVTRWRSGWKKCAPEDILCAAPEIATLAIRASRCMIKGQEAWWR